jgi:HlyD family secretion protein
MERFTMVTAKAVQTNWKRALYTAGVLSICAALATGCTAPSSEAANAATQEQQIKSVKVAKVGKEQIAQPDEVVAEVQPALVMEVMLKVNGEVKAVPKQRGDMVQEGEVIVELDKDDALRNLEKTRLGVLNATETLRKSREDMKNNTAKLETQLNDMQKQYNKMLNDYDLGLVGKFELEQMETTLKNFSNEVNTFKNTNSLVGLEVQQRSAELTLTDTEKQIGYFDVKAPISGIITELPVEPKMSLHAGFRAAQIQQLDKVKIRADLSEAAYKLVEGKKQLELYIPGGKDKYTGEMKYLSPVVSTQTKAYTLELEVANDKLALKPGMRVQVLLNEAQDQEVVVVPTSSIIREGNDTFVFVLSGDTVQKRKVELGRLKDLSQEVLSGVKADEELVISGQFQLKDQEKVQVQR